MYVEWGILKLTGFLKFFAGTHSEYSGIQNLDSSLHGVVAFIIPSSILGSCDGTPRKLGAVAHFALWTACYSSQFVIAEGAHFGHRAFYGGLAARKKTAKARKNRFWLHAMHNDFLMKIKVAWQS